MDLMDLLLKTGAGNSVGQLAGSVGLGESQANDLIGALAPALMRGLQKQTESDSSLQGLQSALAGGSHQRYIDQPELMQSETTRDDGNKILGHVFGSKDVSRNVAAQAAQQTGIDAGIIKKALPLLAGLAMGALSKQSGGADARSLGLGGLSGLIGGLLGGDDGQKGGLDDLLGVVKKLF
jgi:hypothetical protein